MQWDFGYDGNRFMATPEFSFRDKKTKQIRTRVTYKFPRKGTFQVACRVQDSRGGEGTWDGQCGGRVGMFNDFSRYEDAFLSWAKDGYTGAKPETVDYLHHLSDPEDEARPREGTLWPHQWDAFLRAVYAYEIERDALAEPNGVLLNVVTGGGKTAIIAALVAWLRVAHDVQKFALLCPNLIVRDRLEEDFDGGKVFVDRDLIPQGAIVTKGDFALTTLGSDRPRWLGEPAGREHRPREHPAVLRQQQERPEQSDCTTERPILRTVQRRSPQL